MSVNLDTINPSDNPNDGRIKINNNFNALAESAGQNNFSALTSSIISATTISASTIYSGSTNLYNIFLTSADGNDITRVQPGLNTYTGGTANLPTLNVTGGTFYNLTVTGNSSFQGFTATTVSATTITSSTITNVYRYEKTISQAELLTLDSIPVTISAVNLGLTSTQAAKFHQLDTEWWINPNGVPFSGSGANIVLKTNAGATAITHLPMAEVVGTTSVFTRQSNLLSSAFGSASVIAVTQNDGFYFESSGGAITGGGAAAFIKAVLYYEKINF